jgi:hypothetical protein
MRSPFLAAGRWLGLLVPAAAGLVAASLLGVAPAAAAVPGVPAPGRVPARLVLASLNTAATQDGLAGVSCPAARACTAVGGTRNDLSGARLAKAWNGTRWTVQSVPGDGLLMGMIAVSTRVSCGASAVRDAHEVRSA